MDKLLVVVGGGVLQERTFIETKKQGLKTLLIDDNEKCYCRYLTDYFICNSTKLLGSNVSKVEEFLKQHQELSLIGVYTQGTDVAVTVACIATAFGLPSIPFDTACKTSNKIRMRKCFESHDILQPNFIINGYKGLNFPFIVKPADNCASRGVTIVRNPQQINEAIENAVKNSFTGEYLSEEFIEGKEYSVDTIIYQGKLYPAGISDRVFLDKSNYAIQDGSITPSSLPSYMQDIVYEVMLDCAEALEITQGAFKGDILIDDFGEVYPLEVTPRLSGGFDSQYRKQYSFGINLIKATIDLACGKPLDFKDIIPKWFKFSSTFSIFPHSGVIKEIQGLEELKEIPGIKKFFLTKSIGDKVEYKNCADRIIHIIACCDSYQELQETMRLAKQTVEIVTI